MENASKALMMAGGVLISLLVIALLVAFYNNLRSLKSTEGTIETTKQATEFNKQYESYSRAIYGSEILSLANKVEDYNKKESANKGYEELKLELILSNDIDDSYLKKGTYTAEQIVNKIKDINKDVKDIGNTSISGTIGRSRKISQLATMRTGDIEDLGIKYDDYKDSLNKYNAYKSLVTTIKQMTFQYKNFEYDKYNGRIIKMIYQY